MALIKCAECGREISDKALSCPYCGCPKEESGDKNDFYVDGKATIGSPFKSDFKGLRLAISIVMIVLSVFIAFQSIILAMISNDSVWSTGIVLSLVMMTTGIIALVTRKSKSYLFCSGISFALLLVGIFAYNVETEIYSDLRIWGIVSFIFGVIFGYSGITIRNEERHKTDQD